MYKVLVFGMTENPGGVEAFLLNYYSHIDKERIQFDFLVNTHEKIAHEETLRNYGAKIYGITPRSQNVFRFRREIREFFKKHASEYQAIWVNVNSLANIEYLKLAKEYQIPSRIIHSHNSSNMDSRIRGYLHHINRKQIARYATDFWACSQSAAEWFYEGKILEQSLIIPNAIDRQKLSFDSNKRQQIRQQLGWESTFIVGNIGRLHFQKNQLFILEVFNKLYQSDKEVRLILVGQGEDEAMLKEKVKQLGLRNVVHFAGVQSDVSAWLSAMDIFLFPSKFEGMSIASIEAQANGLPVLAAEHIMPPDACLLTNCLTMSLDESSDNWYKKLQEMKYSVSRATGSEIKEAFARTALDIEQATLKVEQLFLRG
ncbi:glycosyltransferase family 1 protein [Aerococcaceae bacterium NML210727]|nr:glycosyltransferase family 1 protein [Aerococcaceae bacterium NML210727]MCW6654802.1 glycosyltransferase family 1 protein [Aerococcaceae bacterium NML201296]